MLIMRKVRYNVPDTSAVPVKSLSRVREFLLLPDLSRSRSSWVIDKYADSNEDKSVKSSRRIMIIMTGKVIPPPGT